MRFHVLRVVLGLFLLIAAGLKIHGLFFDPSAHESILSSPRLQIATIQVELLLGGWLLSGKWGHAAWASTLGFFGILASVSLYLALVGQTTCGCFGRVTVHPGVTTAIDVVILVALGLCRPQTSYALQTEFRRLVPVVMKVGGGAAALLFLSAVGFLLSVDRPTNTLAWLRGESLTVNPSLSDVGEATAGTQRLFTVHLVNHTGRPIQIVGGTTTCACIATHDLPITVPPYQTQPIRVQMTFVGQPGRFQHRFVLYTDDNRQRVVVARFAGQVVESSGL